MAVFSSLWQEVRKGTGDREDLDTEIKSAVNDAVIDISGMFPIRQLVSPETLVTEEGINAYELDDTVVVDVLNVRNTTDTVPLVKGDWYEYDSADFANSNSYGAPRKWFVQGISLYLYSSTPDGSEREITYRYIRRVPDMVEDTDPFQLPREWERPVKLLAKSYVFELLGQNEKAIASYQQMLAVAGSRKASEYWEKIKAKTSSVDFGYYADGDV